MCVAHPRSSYLFIFRPFSHRLFPYWATFSAFPRHRCRCSISRPVRMQAALTRSYCSDTIRTFKRAAHVALALRYSLVRLRVSGLLQYFQRTFPLLQPSSGCKPFFIRPAEGLAGCNKIVTFLLVGC